MESKLEKGANKIRASIDLSKKVYFVAYVVLFCFFMLLFSFGYLLYGKSFIWTVDGLEQQYMFFIMQGEWLRELLTNIFVDHSFVVPMWSDSIGYGADYVYSLGNTLGNPINWISVFATNETAEFWLSATIPLTLFLAGFSFLGYCLRSGFDRSAGLIGCMVYLFGGYTLIVSSQIYMIYPLVLAPLVVWGVDKVFDGESPVLFVLSMSLCFFCSVSLAYTMCLSLLAYCLVKVFFLPEKSTIKRFFLWVLKIASCIFLAALIAGVLFYPNAASLLGQDRLSLDRYQSLTYSFGYYVKLFEGFISPSSVGEDCMYGFAPVAIVSLFALFAGKNLGIPRSTKRMLCVLFVLMTLFLCVPLAGRISNGMAYANNRWVWSYCLLVSVIVVITLPRLANSFEEDRKRVFCIALIYGAICMILFAWYSDKTFYAMLSIMFVVIVICYIFKNKPALFNAAILGTVAVSCIFVSYQYAHGNRDSRVDIGKAYDYTVTDDPSSLVSGLSDHEHERYDSAKVHQWRNGNWATDTIGCTFYNSFYNSAIDQYHTSLGLVSSSMNFSYATLNSRTTLEALAGTKYFLTPTKDNTLLPPLYRTEAKRGEIAGTQYSVYEASEVLPLAFFYDSSISEDDYYRMGLMERQDSLTQSVVLEGRGGSANSVESYSYDVSSQLSFTQSGNEKLPVEDTQTRDEKESSVQIEGNQVTITQPNTVLYLNGDVPKNTEAYFVCTGMKYSPLDSLSSSEGAGLKSALKNMLTSVRSSSAKECNIMVYGTNSAQQIWYMNNRNHLYGGKTDWAVNTGYSEMPRESVALKFCDPGVYTFDSLGLYATDVSYVERDISHLSSNAAGEIEKSKNGYYCQTEKKQDGWLYFRIPYSKGWKAYIDGEETEIVKANLGFMAIDIPSGEHSVSLKYETPNLKQGACISCFAVIFSLLLVFLRKRKHGKWKGERLSKRSEQ